MSVFAYGMRYWKKHVPCAVFCQVLGFLAIALDLLLPLLSALFVDYILTDEGVGTDGGLFAFLVNGRFGEPQTWRLFFSITVVFAVFLVIREITLYIRNVLFRLYGLLSEDELRDLT